MGFVSSLEPLIWLINRFVKNKEALKHRTDLEQKLLTLLEDVPGDTPLLYPFNG